MSVAANGMAVTVAGVIMLTHTATSAFVSIPNSRLLHHHRATAVGSARVAVESQNGSVTKCATTIISECRVREICVQRSYDVSITTRMHIMH